MPATPPENAPAPNAEPAPAEAPPAPASDLEELKQRVSDLEELLFVAFVTAEKRFDDPALRRDRLRAYLANLRTRT
jgi:hypothetical protein